MRLCAAGGAKARGERFEIVVVSAEAKILDLLRPAVREHAPPDVRVDAGGEVQPVAIPLNVETEAAIKALGSLEVGHAENEPIERMHAQRIGAPEDGGLRIHRQPWRG